MTTKELKEVAKKERLETLRFDKLVEDINNKWGHTYIDVHVAAEFDCDDYEALSEL